MHYLILVIALLFSATSLVHAADFDKQSVYQHDTHFPQELEQFPWGLEEGKEPDTSISASGMGVERAHGLVYALVRSKPNVRVYNTEGKLLHSWSPAKVGRVHMLHVGPAGNIWIADNHGHTVTKYTPKGEVLLSLGSFAEAGMDAQHFAEPTDVSTSSDGKFVYVSDGYINKRVVRFDEDGNYLGMWGGKDAGIKDGQFILPHSLTVLNNRVYVADREGARVQVFDLDGKFIADWRDILVPWAMASVGKYILVAGERLAEGTSTAQVAAEKVKGGYVDTPVRQDVIVFNEDGEIVKEISLPQGNLFGQVNWLHAIDVDADGNIYLSDVVGNHVQKWKVQNDNRKRKAH